MFKIFGILIVTASLVGCATPHQNAALAGAIAGAAVASSVYRPAPPPRKSCYSTTYRDAYGNLIRRTTCH